MGIRMSGLMSGLDTEAIVGALMSAQSLKKTKLTNSKTKLEWKQTKWQELNTKLYKLYTDYASKMQLQSSYMTKKATVSDPAKASVTAKTSAVNGSYTMEIENIATSQYMTGAKLNGVTSTKTKLSDLDPDIVNKEIEVTTGSGTSKLTITSDMTIADFTSALKGMGLNASYDTDQQRFFISSKESGADQSFTFTTTALSAEELQAREDIKTAVGYADLSSASQTKVDSAIATLRDAGADSTAIEAAVDTIAQVVYENSCAVAKEEATKYVSAKLYTDNYESYKAEAETALRSEYYGEDGAVKTELDEKYRNDFNTFTDEDKEIVYGQAGVESMTEDEYVAWAAEQEYNKAVASRADSDTSAFVSEKISNDDETKLEIDRVTAAGLDEDTVRSDVSSAALVKYYAGGNDAEVPAITGFEGTANYTLDKVKNDIEPAVTAYANVSSRNDVLEKSALTALGLDDIVATEDGYALRDGASSDIAFISGSDSVIYLNGARLTSSSSTVSANGLSIELTGTTSPGEAITFSVSSDVDSVYNSIKDFLTEYNSIMKEMYTLYTADSATGYDPLTSEEKEAMTDEDVKLWEDKIKDSLLRSDTTLGSLITAMRSAMSSQVEYNGKKYSLSSFGIMTSYDYTEGGQLHIYGDADDSTYADYTDRLRSALEDDPDAVVNVLSSIFGNLRKTMSDKMAYSSVSSALTFYNDKQIKSDLEDYEDQIEKMEEKLQDMEDAYYDKFTAMETALAKLQSQQSALSSLFGS